MSLGSAFDRFMVGKIAGRFVKECPAMTNVFRWLTDPAKPGRKRGIAVIAFLIAGLLKLADAGIGQACEAALLAGTVCTLHVGAYASWVEIGNQAVQTYVVPGADVVGAIVGIWGLLHAAVRTHVVPVR